MLTFLRLTFYKLQRAKKLSLNELKLTPQALGIWHSSL